MTTRKQPKSASSARKPAATAAHRKAAPAVRRSAAAKSAEPHKKAAPAAKPAVTKAAADTRGTASHAPGSSGAREAARHADKADKGAARAAGAHASHTAPSAHTAQATHGSHAAHAAHGGHGGHAAASEPQGRRAGLLPEDRQSQLKLLIARGKEQGYLTYAQVNDHLPAEIVDPEQIEGIVNTINDMGIPVYEKAPDSESLLASEPSWPADDEATEEAAAALAALDAELGRTTDPVRMYMREMGTVELLTREGE